MAKLPDETQLEVDRSQLGLPPMEPTDDEDPTPDFEDMDVSEDDVEETEGLELEDAEDVSQEDVDSVLDALVEEN